MSCDIRSLRVCMCVLCVYCMCVLYVLLFPLRGGSTLTLNSDYKLAELTVQTGWPFYYKSAFIQKPSAQKTSLTPSLKTSV